MNNLIIPVRKGVELRQLQLKDAQNLFDLVKKNNAHLRKWFAWADDDKSVEDTENYIKESLEIYSKTEGVEFVILQNQIVVGQIALHPLSAANKKAALVYWISEEFEGKGIMTDSLKKILKYVFKDLKLNRIEITCGVGNDRSSALPKKLGFKFEGVLREAEWIYERTVDLEVYSLLVKEWNK